MAVDAERAESDRRLAAEKMLGAQVERELEQGWQATVGELEHAQAELLAHQMGATRAQVSPMARLPTRAQHMYRTSTSTVLSP
jgi:hypothetical protein